MLSLLLHHVEVKGARHAQRLEGNIILLDLPIAAMGHSALHGRPEKGHRALGRGGLDLDPKWLRTDDDDDDDADYDDDDDLT